MLTNAFYIAVFAWVFRNVLIAEGNVLGWYGDFLESLYQRGLKWLAKPLGWCGKCMSGQLALWSYPFWGSPSTYGGGIWINPDAPPLSHWLQHPGNWNYLFSCNAYHPIGHILAVTTTIFIFTIIAECLKRLQN